MWLGAHQPYSTFFKSLFLRQGKVGGGGHRIHDVTFYVHLLKTAETAERYRIIVGTPAS